LAFGPQAGQREEENLYLDGSLADFGHQLVVSIGTPEQARTIFRGAISAIEGSYEEGREPEVVIFAEDKLMDLRMTRRMRTYENKTDAEIAEEIAGLHGINAEVDADGPRHDVVQQWNMSDLAFLRQRARLIQAELWWEGEALHFKNGGRRAATEITLVLGNELLSLDVRADLAHQRTKVQVCGYDASDRAAIDEEAGSEAIAGEISSGRTGPEVLERAFGERISYRVREVPLNSGEAEQWARWEMLRRSRAFVTGRGVTRGTPDMMVGSRLSLERVGTPFNGSGYVVTQLRHTYDLENGHRTHFVATRPIIEEAS
jgi:phage protein D